jgi:hypothetical protein
MDGRSLRGVAVMGLMAALALTLLMIFSLSQVADTQTPQIAADIAAELRRRLAPEPPAPVKLTMRREGKGVDASKVYTLRLRPAEALASDERAVDRLMDRAAEMCAGGLVDVKGAVVIRCLAELGSDLEREAVYRRNARDNPTSLSLIALVGPPTTHARTSPARSP